MGTTPSKAFEVIDWSPNRNFSKEHRINEWYDQEPKNAEYYSGERFFKVSRNLYPDYTKGWLYGYNEDTSYWHRVLTCDEDGCYEN